MPAAVTYIGLQIGSTVGAFLIMNSVAIANVVLFTVGPALGPSLRSSVVRTQEGQRA